MGPVGATLANLLGQNGHTVAIAETHSEIYDKPRAINLDQEALRLWQRLGLAADIAEGCAPHPGTDFLGADGELIKAIYSAPPPYPLGWPANLMFVQPKAEQRLREHLATLPNVDTFLQYTAVNFDQSDDTVCVNFDAPDGTRTLCARYLIGCDGANSVTRDWMQAPQTDLGFSEHYVVVDAWLTKDTPLPPRTTQFCRPDAPTSYVVCSGTLRRWELKILPDENIEDYDDLDNIKRRLALFVDVDALNFWRSSVYHFNARVADIWHKQRVFLAGDAAHTMPPFLGQGLNSGLRDAGNLAWKLSYVLNGNASDQLLDTYQAERRPHILALTEITKDLGQIVGETDPDKAALRDEKLRAEMKTSGVVTVRQALIPPLKKGFLDPHGGELAGSMAPQPTVSTANETVLLDELLSGFSLVQYHADNNDLTITNDIETSHPTTFTCDITDNRIFALITEQPLTSFIMRPDGIIWSASMSDTAAAIQRLQTSLNQHTVEQVT